MTIKAHNTDFYIQFKMYNIIIYYNKSYNLKRNIKKGIVDFHSNNIHGFWDDPMDEK